MSEGVDKHGDYKPGEILNGMVSHINGDEKMRMLVNHRRDLPPIGYWDDGEIIVQNNTNCVAAQEYFFDRRIICQWDSSLEVESLENSIVIKSISETDSTNTVISLDKANFASVNEVQKLAQEISKASFEPVTFELHGRKHILPDPELILHFVRDTVLYGFLWEAGKKLKDKVVDDIQDYLYDKGKDKFKDLQKSIAKIVRSTRARTIPKHKTLTTIFEIPGEIYIELIARTDDANKISSALAPRRLAIIKEELKKFRQFENIREIQFELSEKGKWEFSYLITKDSKLIGTKAKFKQRDKLVQRIKLSPTAGFSVGAASIKYDKKIV